MTSCSSPRRGYPAKVLLYGPFARDEATYGSDIDIAATNLEERRQRQGRYGYGYGEGELATAEREAGNRKIMKMVAMRRRSDLDDGNEGRIYAT